MIFGNVAPKGNASPKGGLTFRKATPRNPSEVVRGGAKIVVAVVQTSHSAAPSGTVDFGGKAPRRRVADKPTCSRNNDPRNCAERRFVGCEAPDGLLVEGVNPPETKHSES